MNEIRVDVDEDLMDCDDPGIYPAVTNELDEYGNKISYMTLPIIVSDETPTGSFVLDDQLQPQILINPKLDVLDQLEPISERYVCDTCNEVFRSLKLLNKHKTDPLTDKPFKCDKCPESFNFESNLIPHLATHDLDLLECPVCHKTFKRSASLRAHVLVHQDEDTLICDKCGEEFVSQCLHKEHKLKYKLRPCTIYEPQKPKTYRCLECDCIFKTSTGLKVHNADAHKIKIPKKKKRLKGCNRCSRCERSFPKPSQLARHERIHTGERPFKCDICQKSFSQKNTLQIHMLKHTGKKPFKCTHCNNSFSQKCNLLSHISRLHSPENALKTRKYSCLYCPCEFQNMGVLNRHLVGHYNEHNTFKKTKTQESSEKDATVENKSSNKENVEESVETDACEICKESFRDNHELLEHFKTHSDDKTDSSGDVYSEAQLELDSNAQKEPCEVICDTCNRSFDNVSKLEKHKKKIHPVIICEDLKLNKEITEDIPDIENEKDIETARDIDNINLDNDNLILIDDGLVQVLLMDKDHCPEPEEDEKELKPYKCEICNMSYKKLNSLAQHLLHHSGKQGDKLFTCDSCQITFPNNVIFKNHLIQVHKGEYACGECTKTFSTSSGLKRHKEIHIPGFFYICPICKRGYKTLNSCQKHIHTHNPKQVTRPYKLDKPISDPFELEIGNIKLEKITKEETNKIDSEKVDESENVPNIEKSELVDLQGNLNDIIDFQPGQIYTISRMSLHDQKLHIFVILANEDGVLSLTALKPNEHLLTDQTIPDATFTDNLNENSQIFSEINDDDHNFDSFVFIRDNENVSDQISNFTTEQEEIKCDVCSETFSCHADLTVHKSNFHAKNVLLCQVCSKLCDTIDELEDHFLSHEAEKEIEMNSYQCTECNLEFKTSSELTDHFPIHSKKCKKSTAKRKLDNDIKAMCFQFLESQQKKEQPKEEHPNKCTYCPKSFRKPSDLVRHLRCHTGERPYQCSVCSKEFSLKSSAVSHMRTHSKDVSYECPVCNKLYSAPGSLKIHMRLHTGSRPFSCPLCSLNFRTSGHQRNHFLTHLQKAEFIHNDEDNQLVIVSLDGSVTKFKCDNKTDLTEKDIQCSSTPLIENESFLEESEIKSPKIMKNDSENLINEQDCYQCQICNKKFKNSTDVELHILGSHQLSTPSVPFDNCLEIFADDKSREEQDCGEKSDNQLTLSLDIPNVNDFFLFSPALM